MGRPLVLDRETCFKKWVELGTLKNVSNWFAEQGKINPTTGKNYTRAAISYAARRWVCEYPEEARGYYERGGMILNDEDWYAWLVRTMLKTFHSHDRKYFEKFLDENGLREKYGYIIGEP